MNIFIMLLETLENLDRQWLLLVDRIGQRKSLIDILVSDWSRYYECQQQFNHVLDSMQSAVALISASDVMSIKEANRQLTNLKVPVLFYFLVRIIYTQLFLFYYHH